MYILNNKNAKKSTVLFATIYTGTFQLAYNNFTAQHE